MFLRLVMIVAVAFSANSFVEAAVVQFNFSAELESSSPRFEPVASVDGYFQFDNSLVEDLPSNILGISSYVELIEFGFWTSQGTGVINSGLIMDSNESSTTQVVNGPGQVVNGPGQASPSYLVSVGAVVFPAATTGHENTITDDFEVIVGEDGGITGIATDFSDFRYFVVDVPHVPSPILRLSLYLDENEEVLFDGSHVPPVLSQSLDSKLKFKYQGLTATYLVTSLQIAPEPTTLSLVCVATVFGMMCRCRG